MPNKPIQEKIHIQKLTGLNIGQLYELVFLQTRSRIENKTKFVGFWQARKLFINPKGELLLESLSL